ncbi:MAG: hypothetical protein V4727_04720 [Verrucomicrobiota bacterium]
MIESYNQVKAPSVNLAEICYGIQTGRRSKVELVRRYDLELGKEIVGSLIADSDCKSKAKFRIQIKGMQDLSWEATLHPTNEESSCEIRCPELSWNFQLRIPRKDEGVIIYFGVGDSKIVLMKTRTLIGWEVDSFRLRTADEVEHSWSIAFDTGIAAFIEAIFRLFALGLIPKKNENWILGSNVAKQLNQTDQQKLLILNATIRMWMLPNDFSSVG